MRTSTPLTKEAYMGVGMSMSRNPEAAPTADLALYALHLAQAHPKATVILADSIAIANRMAAFGEEYEEAARKVARETRGRETFLHAVKQAFDIPDERLKVSTWASVQEDEFYQEMLARLRRLRATNPYFRLQLQRLVPEGLRKSAAQRMFPERKTTGAQLLARIVRLPAFARELTRLTDYSLAEIALILSHPGVKVGHGNEERFDRLAAYAAEKMRIVVNPAHAVRERVNLESPGWKLPGEMRGRDWHGVENVLWHPPSGLTFLYLPSSMRLSPAEPIEPYLVGKKRNALLITDSDAELERKCEAMGESFLAGMDKFAEVVPEVGERVGADGEFYRLSDEQRRAKHMEALAGIVKKVREEYARAERPRGR